MDSKIKTVYFAEGFYCPKLDQFFHAGRYTPKTAEEYAAILPYASDPDATPEKPVTDQERRLSDLESRVSAVEAENADLKACLAEYEADDEEGEVAKDELVAKALELKILGTNGKPAAKTTLYRWSIKRLQDAIAAAKE